ncbi:CAP domain-containing protein [Kitasatospora aureofaciens]|uniref:CAP domain-containing protein n=1 Tax=Kitasatospora aureofaciens TaxID=1894 RepID=UPI001C46FBC2|nr:CAP domain-containing protein [Kitasatospora aureofaciens]MBV6701990.1 CAP domain-containing protein [Kitasatospora aureofaciens]
MNDDFTKPIPRYMGEGPGHGPAPEEDTLAPAPGTAGTRTRRTRRRAATSSRRRAAVISAATALVVAGIAGHSMMSSAHSGGGDPARSAAVTGDLPLTPNIPGDTSSAASAPASPSVSASTGPSASAAAGSTGSAGGSPSAPVSAGRNSSTARASKPAATATTGSRSGGAAPATSTPPAATPPAGSRSGGAAPVTSTPPATGTGAQFAQQVADLTNIERAKAGCGPLTVNAQAQSAAQVHSDDMVARHYFEHPDPEGHHADYRLEAAGYRWSLWGENIAYGQPDPAAVVDEWMHSPPHRENILNCHFTAIGVGVNFGPNGPWWTQVFASPA